MAEENKEAQTEQQEEQSASTKAEALKLKGIFATKLGMSSVFSDDGEAIPVTVLKYEPWVVTQLKTKEKDGYEALQISSRPKKAKNANAAEKGHCKAAGFENGAAISFEIRQDLPNGVQVGDKVSLESLVKGDKVRLTSKSKGRGFAGVIKRWGFGGGPAAHGSKFHRQPGSIGNRTWPGRVIPGKKLPGHFGFKNVTVKNVEVVDVLTDENVVLVKGPVPGARNTLVKLMKV
ncbi:MAG: 50S ribosomal protein L3 [Bdellovibrionales bacterium]|nr:50S ribosomal protein L3 [Bdellovibrionales bacterium]MCB0392057.1 50S ribosomal protein L3 [Bdellovibrionales bacterium]